MPDQASVTILIPSYNPGAYLKEALESVLAQTCADWHVVLVDDASDDDGLAAVEPLDPERFTIVRQPENQGQAAALNRGMAEVDSAFVLQLDSDDWLSPEAVEQMLQGAQEDPDDVGVWGGNLRVFVQHPSGACAPASERIGRPYDDRYAFLMDNRSLYPRFFRTSALRSVGGWPVDVPQGGRILEDMLVLYRLIENWRFGWVDCFAYNHRRHRHNQTNQTVSLAQLKEWAVRDALARWGDSRVPVFRMESGYCNVVRLDPPVAGDDQ